MDHIKSLSKTFEFQSLSNKHHLKLEILEVSAAIVISQVHDNDWGKDVYHLNNDEDGQCQWKSLHSKLTHLYFEAVAKDSEIPEFCSSSNLLKKLVKRDKLNCLVVNLYPGNEGYSLMLKSRNNYLKNETLRLPYEEEELLQYIDNKDLPPILVDLFEQAEINIFYDGCIIVELRDYRRLPNNPSTEFVLLKPSTQTLISDVNAITNDNQRWTYEEKQQLESTLLSATQPPLCLDPSPAVAIVANHMQYESNILNHASIKKNLNKYSQVSLNRRKKFNQLPAPSCLKLYDYLKKKNSKTKMKKTLKCSVDSWKVNPVNNNSFTPSEPIPRVPIPEKKVHNLNFSQILVEEYIIETEKREGKMLYIKLKVLQKTSDDVYVGELYVNHDYAAGQANGSPCNFDLGSKDQVTRYVSQFKDLCTEEGRKAVKITHNIPGIPSKITYTQGTKERNHIDVDSDPKKVSQLMKDAQVTVPSLVSTSEQGKNINANKLLPTVPRQQPSPSKRSESSVKVSLTASLPTYSQALSGNIKSTLRPTQLLKKSISDINAVDKNMSAIGDKQTASSLSSGDIIVNQPTSIPCTNITPGMSLTSVPIPQNISLQNITRLPLQVSLTTMPQGLAVPISIAMVDTSQTAGVIVSSGSNIIACSSPSSTSLAKHPITIASTSTLAPTGIMSSGVVSNQSSVIATPANVLSLPVGVASNLNAQNLTTQLMTSSMKNSAPGFRTNGGGLSLLQVSGTQQSIPLFSQVSSPVLTTSSKPMVSCVSAGNNSGERGQVQPPLLTLNPQQQQQLQSYLQKQPIQHIQQIQIHPSSTNNKVKPQKRTHYRPPGKAREGAILLSIFSINNNIARVQAPLTGSLTASSLRHFTYGQITPSIGETSQYCMYFRESYSIKLDSRLRIPDDLIPNRMVPIDSLDIITYK
ncbi:Transcription factor SPT20 [Nymphon striatum]|nr:Transcription factor SPT20 [Nymphon striatum]